jgi:hypothetical protein
MERDYYEKAIRTILTHNGFDKLDKPKADEVMDVIDGFISDLAYCGWDGEELGYGG